MYFVGVQGSTVGKLGDLFGRAKLRDENGEDAEVENSQLEPVKGGSSREVSLRNSR